jgi:hypothetical protein
VGILNKNAKQIVVSPSLYSFLPIPAKNLPISDKISREKILRDKILKDKISKNKIFPNGEKS